VCDDRRLPSDDFKFGTNRGAELRPFDLKKLPRDCKVGEEEEIALSLLLIFDR
jgi:hypothetical protein